MAPSAFRQSSEFHEQLIRALQHRTAYPHPVDDIEVIETHISSVLLAGDFAYKIKKPVDLGFVDYKTLERREYFCREELRLNRRLAPNLYLDVVAITGSEDTARIGGRGSPIEYAVKMRRFSQEHLLSRVLERGELGEGAIEFIARTVANFHADIQTAGPDTPFGTPEVVLAPMRQNFVQLRPLLTDEEDCAQLARIESWTEQHHEKLREALAQRKSNGFIRECHGDLHLGNMVMADGEPTIFDGIEFNDELRYIDVINELAFLIMDLAHRGAPFLANRALNVYLHERRDYAGLKLLRLYQVYRALVRAKIARIRLGQDIETEQERRELEDEYRSYADLAERYTAIPHPCIVITHGVTGSGKSTASRIVAGAIDAIWLRSDVERKRLDGAHDDDTGIDRGRYSPGARDAVYEHLLKCADDLIESGFAVLIDATFLKTAQRERFSALAIERQIPFLILDVTADEAELRRRVSRRKQRGDDPSEADLEVLDLHLKTREPLSERELRSAVRVEHAQQPPISEIERRCKRDNQPTK